MWPNGAAIVSNMSQSVQNIIINDEKHIFDLNKSHKDNLKKVVDPILSIAKYVYNIPSNFRVSSMKYRFRLQKGLKFWFFISLYPLKYIFIHVWRLSLLESHRSKVDDSFQYSMFWCCFGEIFPGPQNIFEKKFRFLVDLKLLHGVQQDSSKNFYMFRSWAQIF